MDEKVISLCISYPSWGDPERQMLFRIADYYPEEDAMYSVQFDDPEYVDEAKESGSIPETHTHTWQSCVNGSMR